MFCQPAMTLSTTSGEGTKQGHLLFQSPTIQLSVLGYYAAPSWEYGICAATFLGGRSGDTGKANPQQPGILYLYQGRYSEAEPLYERSLSIFEKVLPANHPTLAIGRGNLEQLRSQLDSGA